MSAIREYHTDSSIPVYIQYCVVATLSVAFPLRDQDFTAAVKSRDARLFDTLEHLIDRADSIEQFMCDLQYAPLTNHGIESRKQANNQEKSGYVYLLRADNGIYKIGRTKRLDDRITRLSVELPYQLELICAIATDDMHDLEGKLHHRFADQRVNGEWFSLTNENVESIKEVSNEQATP